MDAHLKELCIEVINQNLSSDRFISLLIETGIKLESFEWDVANKILEKGDEINVHLNKQKGLIH